jgi:hypothetical protein
MSLTLAKLSASMSSVAAATTRQNMMAALVGIVQHVLREPIIREEFFYAVDVNRVYC